MGGYFKASVPRGHSDVPYGHNGVKGLTPLAFAYLLQIRACLNPNAKLRDRSS